MKKTLALFMLCSSFALFTGCLKEGDDTLILPPYPLEDKPTTGFGDGTTNAVIPAAIRETFKNHMPINEGKYPPSIVGQYLQSATVAVYCSDNGFAVGDSACDCYYQFYDQTSNGMCKFNTRQLTITGHSDTVWIVGQGNKFTAFFVEKETYNDTAGTWCISSNLISGEITSGGIKNFYMAFIMLDKYDPMHKIMDVNEYRIFKDSDGLAVNNNWNSKALLLKDGDADRPSTRAAAK